MASIIKFEAVVCNVRAACLGASRNAPGLLGVSNQKPASELARACRALSTRPREKYDYLQMRDGERVMEAIDVDEGSVLLLAIKINRAQRKIININLERNFLFCHRLSLGECN